MKELITVLNASSESISTQLSDKIKYYKQHRDISFKLVVGDIVTNYLFSSSKSSNDFMSV